MHKTLAITALMMLGGCGGQLEAEGNAEISNVHPQPAPPRPLLAWQMAACLDDDHRKGLILALQKLASGHVALARLASSVGQSMCIGGQEFGALFDPTSTATGRAQRLAQLDFRSLNHGSAFLVDVIEIQDIAQRDAAFWSIHQRFDDSGTITPTGRYQVGGYTANIDVYGSFEQRWHVGDLVNNVSADLVRHGDVYADKGSLAEFASSAFVNPASTSDPLVQTVVNATNKYLTKYNGHGINVVDPVFDALQALDLSAAPSLSGWPIPFAAVAGDGTGNLVAQAD